MSLLTRLLAALEAFHARHTARYLDTRGHSAIRLTKEK